MAKEIVPASDWPMYDWMPHEIVVDGLVMALEGCSSDDDSTRVAVITESGRELRICGVRKAAGGIRVDIIVADEEYG